MSYQKCPVCEGEGKVILKHSGAYLECNVCNGLSIINEQTGLSLREEKMFDKKEIINYISRLLNESFECWNDDEIRGYKTALTSIREFVKILKS